MLKWAHSYWARVHGRRCIFTATVHSIFFTSILSIGNKLHLLCSKKLLLYLNSFIKQKLDWKFWKMTDFRPSIHLHIPNCIKHACEEKKQTQGSNKCTSCMICMVRAQLWLNFFPPLLWLVGIYMQAFWGGVKLLQGIRCGFWGAAHGFSSEVFWVFDLKNYSVH